MKKLLTFLMFFLLASAMAQMQAAETVFYTMTTPKSTSNSAYATYYDVTIGGMKWNAPGNQSVSGCWRIGGNSLDKVDRVITAKSPMGSAISHIYLYHNGTSNANLTVNSITVNVYSDANLSDENKIDTWKVNNPTISYNTSDTVEISPTPIKVTTWPSNAYYEFVFNFTNSKSSNYGLNLTKIEFLTTSTPPTPAKTLESIAVSGTPTKTTYTEGETFDPAGLTVTGTYSNGDQATITEGINWTFDPETLTAGTTSVSVTAKVGDVTSSAYTVNDLTVNPIPTKTISEFISNEGGKCYLIGTVSDINNTTYGNYTLTDESGSIYIYGTLTPEGESKKFNTLDVVAGDKIKVLANEYEYFQNTTHEAKNVIFVEEYEIEKAKHVVTIETPVNGTLQVMNGEDVVASGSEVEEGTTLTVVCTPADGYKYRNWQYKFEGGSWTTKTSDMTLNVTKPVSIRGNFELIPVYTINWSVNGSVVKTETLQEGAAVTAPETVESPINDKIFMNKWVTSPIEDAVNPAPAYVTPGPATANVTYYAVFATKSGGGTSTTVNDVLNQELTGVTGGYTDFSGKTSNSDAVYAGKCAGNNKSIQLRSDATAEKPASGVVTTTSGGFAKKIVVEWQSSTASGRALQVYGSNSAYTEASDLVGENKGDLLGTIVCGTSTELEISGDYKYIGFRSASGAMYLSSVTITWQNGSGESYSDFTTLPAPVVKTLDHIEVVEGYKADYTDGDAFEKATVMAYYQEEGVEPVNVTAKAEFSGYNLSAETSGEQTVNVSYTEGEVTAETSYTINFTAVTKYTVTIVPPVNGRLKVVVKATGAEIATGARVADGTVLKITNTPDEDYVLRKIVVTDTEKHNYTAQNKEITVNGSDVTINAIFVKGDNYTYTWSVNGEVVSQDDYKAGETVTAPAVTAAGPDGKTFVGWSRTATVDADNCTLATVDPTAVTNRTYFAVFATVNTKPSTDGSNVYYEKVDLGDTSWLNEKFLLVYEQTSNAALIFDGQPSGATNVIGANITEQNGKKVITDKSTGQELEVEYYGAYNTNMRMKLVGSNPVKYLATTGSGQSKFQIEEKDNLGTEAYAGFTVDNTDNGRWNIKVYDRYLNYSGSDFRLGNIGANREIQIYAKKGGTVTTYSEYTTGMEVNPREFQLVTNLEKDLQPGREYIIVSKFINDDDSRTIYGLSVDNADSRTENGQDGDSKTTTNYRRGETGVTFSHGDYFASINNKISVLILGVAEGTWTFNSAAGYLVKGGNETDRFLRINNESAPATIAKDDKDVATIKFANAPDREVFLNINGGYPRYGAYAHNNLTDTDKKYNFAASYLYYREADPTKVETLAEIEANGINGTDYTIADDLEVVFVQGERIWAKDNADSYAKRENTYEGVENYLKDNKPFQSYSQNNWIEIVFPGTALPEDIPAAGSILSGVKGTYLGYKDRYHVMRIIKHDGKFFDNVGKAGAYTLNTYTMASLWDDNIYDYAVAESGKKFFLMNPKMEEYCTISDAVWNGTCFTVPAPEEITTDEGKKFTVNGANFKGIANVDWSLNDNIDPKDIDKTKRYKFTAIVTKGLPAATSQSAAAKVGSLTGMNNASFTIRPIDFKITDSVITAVDDVKGAKTVKGVRYYNVAGVEFGEAQPGLNIIVTEYSDGSHSAVKVIR